MNRKGFTLMFDTAEETHGDGIGIINGNSVIV